jgi:glycine/D-amino acid oxidase-like deaminating enzyme
VIRGQRVVVIGAGIVGATLAYRLAEAGAKVTLADRGAPGGATSANSFAAVSASDDDAPAGRPMWATLIAELRTLAADVGGDWLHLDGALSWADDADAATTRGARQRTERRRRSGRRVEIATPQEIMRDLEPDLFIDPDRVSEVFVTPDEGWVEVVPACQQVVVAAELRHGARLERAEVSALERSADRVTEVRLAGGGTLAADLVVNAAGPWAGDVAEMAGSRLAVGRGPGGLVVTTPAPQRLRHVVWAPTINLRPELGGRVMIQREEHDRDLADGRAPDLRHPFARGAIADAARLIPALKSAAIAEVRYGVRPLPKDGAPIIGPDAAVAGLYHVVMHSGVRRAAVSRAM